MDDDAEWIKVRRQKNDRWTSQTKHGKTKIERRRETGERSSENVLATRTNPSPGARLRGYIVAGQSQVKRGKPMRPPGWLARCPMTAIHVPKRPPSAAHCTIPPLSHSSLKLPPLQRRIVVQGQHSFGWALRDDPDGEGNTTATVINHSEDPIGPKILRGTMLPLPTVRPALRLTADVRSPSSLLSALRKNCIRQGSRGKKEGQWPRCMPGFGRRCWLLKSSPPFEWAIVEKRAMSYQE